MYPFSAVAPCLARLTGYIEVRKGVKIGVQEREEEDIAP